MSQNFHSILACVLTISTHFLNHLQLHNFHSIRLGQFPQHLETAVSLQFVYLHDSSVYTRDYFIDSRIINSIKVAQFPLYQNLTIAIPQLFVSQYQPRLSNPQCLSSHITQLQQNVKNYATFSIYLDSTISILYIRAISTIFRPPRCKLRLV